MIKKIAKNVLRPVLTPFRPGNIVMFHIGRCGSTVLSTLLEQHQNVFWASEIYEPIFKKWRNYTNGKEIASEMPEDAIIYLKKSMQKAFHRYYGFEVKPFHIRLIGYSEDSFLENLDALGFSHYIFLDRRNRLRKIVSSLIAHKDRMRYHQDSEITAKLKHVFVDVNNVAIDYDQKPLLSFLSDYDKDVASIRSMLKTKNCLDLTYEEHVQNEPRVGYQQICEFIGIKPKEVTIKLSRTNPFPVRNMIENFEEVENILKGTEYEWMLYD
ncbi:MAG: hypothetical protein JXB49_32575 [Bacteroidales bacterium]|nr:hypothetical protein [Bacteroidales bacterium]